MQASAIAAFRPIRAGYSVQDEISVVIDEWARIRQHAQLIRFEVFVQEQHVPAHEELDEDDEHCAHAVAYTPEGLPIGTGRLLPNAHIGRMAVLAAHRGKGVGSRLLTALMEEARRRNFDEVVLAAQLQAQGFYSAHGFVPEGQVYLDAGIEHVTMRRAI